MDIIGKKAVKISDEIKSDDTGQIYRATEWDYQGNKFEVNVDLDDRHQPVRYHAKANGDDRTMRVNMDEGGLVGWFMGLFGK